MRRRIFSIAIKQRSNHLSFRRSTSLTQSRTIPNLETEYIKQLQEQIYYLETECLYLRDQLNKNSIVLDRSLQTDRLVKVEQERNNLQRSLVHTASHYDQLTSEKHGLQIALDELRIKFEREKQNLLDELEMLRRARETIDQERNLRDQELRQSRERARAAAEELKSLETKVRVLEQQLEQQLNQNRDLNDELRRSKLESNSLQRSVNDFQLATRERDRLQGVVSDLEKELATIRLDMKSQDTRYNEAQFLRNKLAEEKGALMKEVSRLEHLTKDLQRELDQLRSALRERTDAGQSKDKELAALRKKEQNYISTIESIQTKWDSESTRNKDLDLQIKQLQRQLNIEIQNTSTAKRDLNEHALTNTRLRDEINLLQRDRDNLSVTLSNLQQRLTSEEDLTNSLRLEIQELEDRVKEIDRLKSLEDLIQSQRWEDMTQMAQTMQSVSRTMARATSPTTVRKRLEYS